LPRFRGGFQFGSSAVWQFGNLCHAGLGLSLAGILAVALTLVSCTMWKPPKTAGWSSATAPDQYERLMWEAVQRGDLGEVTRHLSSNFVRITPGARQDRDAALDHLRKLKLTSFEITDLTSAPAGDDMIVTYTLALHGSYSGNGSSGDAGVSRPL